MSSKDNLLLQIKRSSTFHSIRESLELLISPISTFRKGRLSTRKFAKTAFYRSFIRNFEHAFPLRFLSLCSRTQISRAPHLKEIRSNRIVRFEKRNKKKRKKRASKNRGTGVRTTNLNNGETNVRCSFRDRRESRYRSIARLFIVNSVLRDEIHSSQ